MKTILITGCSSGFGMETARYFLARDWKVIATMRKPQDDILPRSPNLQVLPLDVTQADSIRKTLDAAGPIDALVNNAGIGLLNALEGISMEAVREIFETNTFGTIAMTKAVIPQFRERKSGVIVNVTSAVTLTSLPLLAVYTASKAAVNAFTESLALEMEPFHVRVKLVIPGRSPETRFSENARKLAYPEPYLDLVQRVFASWEGNTGPATHASDVAEAVWSAVNNWSGPSRLHAGEDALRLAELQRFNGVEPEFLS